MNTLTDQAHTVLAAMPAERREEYLHTASGLPLAQAAADLCDERTFRRWLASGDEYLATCAAIGLGRLIAAGRGHLWPLVREAAHDPRPRVREGVAMGLRRVADADPDGLLDELERWVDGPTPLRRAAVDGVTGHGCTADPAVARRVVLLVDRITWTLRHDLR